MDSFLLSGQFLVGSSIDMINWLKNWIASQFNDEEWSFALKMEVEFYQSSTTMEEKVSRCKIITSSEVRRNFEAGNEEENRQNSESNFYSPRFNYCSENEKFFVLGKLKMFFFFSVASVETVSSNRRSSSLALVPGKICVKAFNWIFFD